MPLKSSKETVLTNLVQQGVGLLLFFLVPNYVSVNDFSQITYVNVLISFSLLSDFGLAMVYTRKVPSLLARHSDAEVEEWGRTVFWVKFIGSGLFSLIISGMYYIKYGLIFNAFLLLFFTPLTALTSFHITKYMAHADFKGYRRLNTWQACVKLIMLPLVYAGGIIGWFVGLSAAAFLALFGVNGRVFYKERTFDWLIISKHWVEGLLLVLVTVLWTQLLASARFFAVMLYSEETIAGYGLVNGGYQVLSALVIAGFIPFTIHIYKSMQADERRAVMQIFRVVNWAIPIFFVVGVIGAETAPYMFRYFFPKYNIDSHIIKALIFSIAGYPLVITMGNIFVARKKAFLYVVITASAIAVEWVAVVGFHSRYGVSVAAIAQMATIYFYGIVELGIVAYLYRHEMPDIRWRAFLSGIWLLSLGGAYSVLRLS